MRILGIDPGIKHTGWCMLEDGKPVAHGLIKPPGRGPFLVCEVLCTIIPTLARILSQTNPDAVVVEEVTWYGSPRKAMLPLATISGAVLALPVARSIPSYLLLASQRDRVRKWPKSWTEHERDAAALAQGLLTRLVARDAATESGAPRFSDILIRRTIAGGRAP